MHLAYLHFYYTQLYLLYLLHLIMHCTLQKLLLFLYFLCLYCCIICTLCPMHAPNSSPQSWLHYFLHHVGVYLHWNVARQCFVILHCTTQYCIKDVGWGVSGFMRIKKWSPPQTSSHIFQENCIYSSIVHLLLVFGSSRQTMCLICILLAARLQYQWTHYNLIS